MTSREVYKSAFFFFFKQLPCSLGSHYLASFKASHTKWSTHLLVQRQVVCSAGGATTQVLFMLVQRSGAMFSKVRPGTDPAAKEADKCGLPVCFRGRNCVLNTKHCLGKFFFFFFKASLKDKQVELRLVVYLPKVTTLLSGRGGIQNPMWPQSPYSSPLCCPSPLANSELSSSVLQHRVELCTWHGRGRGPAGSRRQ